MLKLIPINSIPKPPQAIIFTCNQELDSASELAKALKVPVYTNLPKNIDEYDADGTIIIRWGIGHDHHYRDFSRGDFANVLNPAKSIRLNVCKKDALKVISKKVLTPKIYEKLTPKNKLVVYRPDSHSAGKGFNVVKGGFRVEFGHYATSFIKTDTEYRVWCVNGKTMIARRWTSSKKKKAQKYQCRSSYLYKFLKKTPKKLESQCFAAMNELGLHFGAFDILRKGNKYYFLEFNTGVSLDEGKLITFYKNGLKSLIKKYKVVKLIRKYKPAPIIKPLWTINAKGQMVFKGKLEKTATIKPIENTKPIGANWWNRFTGSLNNFIS